MPSGEIVPLSAKEFQLLRYFVENRGTTLSRERILQEVWGYHSTTQTRTADVHIAWLRQKLEPEPKRPTWIVTVHKLGYLDSLADFRPAPHGLRNVKEL